MHAVILDDLTERHEQFTDQNPGCDITRCYNIAQFVHHLVTYPGHIDLVSLDHDLGDESVTGNGFDAAKVLVNYIDYKTEIRVHSFNTPKAMAMLEFFERFGFRNCRLARL